MTFEEIIEKTADIPSHVLPAEQQLWYDFLSNLNIKSIVDFGTGWGKSAKSLALICPEATVLTFDTGDYYVKNNIVDNYSDYASKVQEYLRGMKNIQFRLAHSTLDDWHLIVPKIFKKFQVEVINLDSEWLNKEITKKELEIWLPLLKKDGWLFVHDWHHNVNDNVHEEIMTCVRAGKIKLIKEVNCDKYTVGAFRKL